MPRPSGRSRQVRGADALPVLGPTQPGNPFQPRLLANILEQHHHTVPEHAGSRAGWAWPATIPPNGRCARKRQDAARAARQNGRSVYWQANRQIAPAVPRRAEQEIQLARALAVMLLQSVMADDAWYMRANRLNRLRKRDVRPRVSGPVKYLRRDEPNLSLNRPGQSRFDYPLVTERDAAELLGVSVTYLRRLRRLGLVPAYTLPPARGGRPTIRYSPRDLQAWLERRRGRGWKLP